MRWMIFLLGLWMTTDVQAETLVDRLIALYEQVDTVTCEVRKDAETPEGNVRWLSRVQYQRPDRLHVENYVPIKRRIISDGTTMFQYNDGFPRGFRSPIADLSEPMLHSLRKVPGTAMEHLFRLNGVPETVLEGDGAFPIRRAYAAKIYVVLHADEQNRLGRIEFYDAADHARLTGEVDFSEFQEVIKGVWIPMMHVARFTVNGQESKEITRITNFTANEPIAGSFFVAEPFFPEVEWVARFEDL